MFQNTERNDRSSLGSLLIKLLVVSGIPIVLFAAALACRFLWEETSLTFQQGPQMIGFSLAHGSAAMLVFAPVLLAIWLLISLIAMTVFLFRRKRLSKWFWSTGCAAVFVLALLLVPPVFWQWLFNGSFARSPYANDLMISAANAGDRRTVQRYLAHGIPLEAKDYEGATALFAAASAGENSLIEVLLSRGANINAVNSYGDTPLQAAIQNHQTSTAALLKAHGAVQIEGTPEQRDAAAEAIVQRDIKRMEGK